MLYAGCCFLPEVLLGLNLQRILLKIWVLQGNGGAKENFAGNELTGKTLGIVGLGSIGSMLAQAAHTLGMRLVGYDPYISIEGAWRLPREVEKLKPWKLLQQSDYVSLHVPLVEAKKNLINTSNLKIQKRC